MLMPTAINPTTKDGWEEQRNKYYLTTLALPQTKHNLAATHKA